MRWAPVRGGRVAAVLARGLGLAPHHHGGRDGGQPRPRVGTGRDRLSDSLREQLERGREVTALDYQQALARIPTLNDGLRGAVPTLRRDAHAGRAGHGARGLESTGDPAFCTLWTLCGMPALSLPLMSGENGLPLGVQLVGPRGDDARLLRTARWLVRGSQAAEPKRSTPKWHSRSSPASWRWRCAGFLAPVVVKLKDVALAAVILIGIAMMLVDLWQSLRSRI